MKAKGIDAGPVLEAQYLQLANPRCVTEDGDSARVEIFSKSAQVPPWKLRYAGNQVGTTEQVSLSVSSVGEIFSESKLQSFSQNLNRGVDSQVLTATLPRSPNAT